MGFLYLVRCSVHGTALKKNIPNLSRTVKADDPSAAALMGSPPVSPAPNMRRPAPIRSRKFSEAVDIEAVIEQPSNGAAANADASKTEAAVVIHAKPTNIPLKEILLQYGYSQFVVTLVGGIAITPAVAASPTMFTVSVRGCETNHIWHTGGN
jgi:hypothetical protein